MTIKEQAALIPRPTYEGIETDPNHIEFSIAQVAVKAAVTPVEAPQPVVEDKPAYIDLASLSDREIARMSLKAFKYDVLTFGRNQQYKRFKARVAEEKDLATDMQLGLVQQVHCRLHEKLLSSR
jgi:hypothetical protein